MHGKTVVVTGGNAGIGRATARQLAQKGARVVLTARDPARGEEAAAALRAERGADVTWMPLDLGSLRSAETFAAEFCKRYDKLDVLINNAGAVLSERTQSEDGYEMTFQVNHLGAFLLTRRLLGALRAAAPARIVNVSSMVHRLARGVDWDEVHGKGRYVGFLAYCRAKLANLLFTRELARRLGPDEIAVNALHPGTIASRFGRDGDTRGLFALGVGLARPFLASPERGAALPVYLASSAEVADVTGAYFERGRRRRPSAAARDDEAARVLWDQSVELCERALSS